MRNIKKYDAFITEDLDLPKQVLDDMLLGQIRRYVNGESNLQICRRILNAGADPNYKDVWGAAALHYVLRHPEMVELLLEFNADPDTEDRFGKTPLESIAKKFLSKVKQGLEDGLTGSDVFIGWFDDKQIWQKSAKLLILAGASVFDAFKDPEDVLTFFEGDIDWMPVVIKNVIMRNQRSQDLFGED